MNPGLDAAPAPDGSSDAGGGLPPDSSVTDTGVGDAGTAEPCDEAVFSRRCDGSTVVYCHDGLVSRTVCPELNGLCVLDGRCAAALGCDSGPPPCIDGPQVLTCVYDMETSAPLYSRYVGCSGGICVANDLGFGECVAGGLPCEGRPEGESWCTADGGAIRTCGPHGAVQNDCDVDERCVEPAEGTWPPRCTSGMACDPTSAPASHCTDMLRGVWCDDVYHVEMQVDCGAGPLPVGECCVVPGSEHLSCGTREKGTTTCAP